MIEYKTILTQSPQDDRDFIGDFIYSSETVPPKTLDLRTKLQPIRNQGSQGSCVAQSACAMKEYQEKIDINNDEHLSPQFIYNLRESNSGEGEGGYGMYGRDLMRILTKYGVCLESEYRYGTIQKSQTLLNNSDLLTKAKNHVIKSYSRINTIDALKKALFVNGPCVICFPVYNHGPKMWKRENPDQKMTGGHAMSVVGYTKDRFIIRNSWGTNWGNHGYCYYDFSEWGSHWEIWSTVDEKSIEPKRPPKVNIKKLIACCK